MPREIREITVFPSPEDLQYKGYNIATEYVETIEKLISILKISCETLCDPFAGLNTTAIGALKRNCFRVYYGIDINPLYVSLSRRRVQRWLRFLGYSYEEYRLRNNLGFLILAENKKILFSSSSFLTASIILPRIIAFNSAFFSGISLSRRSVDAWMSSHLSILLHLQYASSIYLFIFVFSIKIRCGD